MITFSIRLKDLRKELNLNLRQLEKAIGFSRSIISRWENCQNEPTLSAIIALCNFFNVSADYLLGLSDY